MGRSQAAAGSQKSLSTAGRPGSDPLVRQRWSAAVNFAHLSLMDCLLTPAGSLKGSAEPALPAVAALSDTDRCLTVCMHTTAARCQVNVRAGFWGAMMKPHAMTVGLCNSFGHVQICTGALGHVQGLRAPRVDPDAAPQLHLPLQVLPCPLPTLPTKPTRHIAKHAPADTCGLC